MDFTKSCECCGKVLLEVRGAKLEAWRGEVVDGGRGPGIGDLGCPTCGCELRLIEARDEIGHRDVSKPQIRSVARDGDRVTIEGHRLDIARDLVVSVNGERLGPADFELEDDTLSFALRPGRRILGGAIRQAVDAAEVVLVELANCHGVHADRGCALLSMEGTRLLTPAAARVCREAPLRAG